MAGGTGIAGDEYTKDRGADFGRATALLQAAALEAGAAASSEFAQAQRDELTPMTTAKRHKVKRIACISIYLKDWNISHVSIGRAPEDFY
jgi:hypothetical protein